MALKGANDNEKLKDLASKTYKEQGVWYLNAFWGDKGQAEAENVWAFARKMAELDKDKGKEGSALDEFQAHRFLEQFKETLTVLEMRERLTKVGVERAKHVSLVYYLIFKFELDWKFMVNTKGDNSAELAEAQRMLDAVIAAFAESEKQAKIARDAEAEARRQEAPFKAAQEEVDTALADVKRQEDAFNNRTNDLKKRSEEGGVVAQNKAKAELAQHLAEDPLPLRKAKVTLEAALKKAEKARAPFEASTKIAEAARAKADAALDDAQKRVAETEAYVDEVKRKPGTPHGGIWWLERELQEQKSYLPERKGGVKRTDTLK